MYRQIVVMLLAALAYKQSLAQAPHSRLGVAEESAQSTVQFTTPSEHGTSSVARFVITSDPQHPFVDKGLAVADDSLGQCAEVSDSIRRIRAQYDNIREYRLSVGGTIPVLINGDYTHYGDHDPSGYSDCLVAAGYSRGTYKDLMNRLVSDILSNSNVYVGLGNHDYAGLDCADNGCAGGMLEWLQREVQSHYRPDSFDLYEEEYYVPPFGTKYIKSGSYSYAKAIGDFFFIQLNNYPNHTDHFETGTSGFGHKHEYRIRDSINWLEDQLKTANVRGKIPIVNTHIPYNNTQWWADSEGKRRFSSLISQYNVAAVFSGHQHYIESGDINGTPYFNSGASMKGEYLIAEYHPNQNKIKIYKVLNNRYQEKQLMREVDAVPPILPPWNLEAWAQGGVGERVALSWNGPPNAVRYEVFRWFKKIADTTSTSYDDYPASAPRYHVKAVDARGRVSQSSAFKFVYFSKRSDDSGTDPTPPQD